MDDERKELEQERVAIKNESGQTVGYAVPMPDYIKTLCKQHGIRLKSFSQGKELCPF